MCTRRLSVDVGVAVQMLLLVVYRLFTMSKRFCKTRLKSKWNTTSWVVAAENFREQRNNSKGSLFFRMEYSKQKFVFHCFKAFFRTSFRPSWSFLSKWNGFVQMINAIPAQNLAVLNFAYHLPKPSTDRFATVNGKQPLIHSITDIYTPYKHRLLAANTKFTLIVLFEILLL